MPQVGDKEFPYTKSGIAAAKAEAKTSGKKIVSRKSRSYKEVAKRVLGKNEERTEPVDNPAEDAAEGNPFKGAIKRPGALTAAVGGKPSQNTGKVQKLAKSGSPLQKKEASFYLNVLRK